MPRLLVQEIRKALKGIDFPAEKEDLIEYARDNGADPEIVEMLQGMPEEEFDSMSDVMSACGEVSEGESRREH
jgi:hypothetical protein